MPKQEPQTVTDCNVKMRLLEEKIKSLEADRRLRLCPHKYIDIEIYPGGWWGRGVCKSCRKNLTIGSYRYDRIMKKAHKLLTKV